MVTFERQRTATVGRAWQWAAFASTLLTCLVASAATAAPSASGGVAYVRATSQLAQDDNPARYNPLNLLDGDPSTVWCESRSPFGEGEEVTFHFKTAQTVDRVFVAPAPRGGRTVDTVRVSDGKSTMRVHLAEGAVEQPLKPALHGTDFTFTIETTTQTIVETPPDTPGVAPAAPSSAAGPLARVACLADVALYHGSQSLTASRARAFDMGHERLVGAWAAQPLGASEKFLVFALDGTWTWTHRPLLGGKSKNLSGTYRLQGGRLLLRKGTSGRLVDVGLVIRRVKVDGGDVGAPREDYDLLMINNNLTPELGATYTNARF